MPNGKTVHSNGFVANSMSRITNTEKSLARILNDCATFPCQFIRQLRHILARPKERSHQCILTMTPELPSHLYPLAGRNVDGVFHYLELELHVVHEATAAQKVSTIARSGCFCRAFSDGIEMYLHNGKCNNVTARTAASVIIHHNAYNRVQ